MASQAERNHQLRVAVSWLAMMHGNGPLSTLQSRTVRHSTTVAVAGQDLFPVTTEVFFILPFQRVASGTEAQRENLIVPAGTAD